MFSEFSGLETPSTVLVAATITVDGDTGSFFQFTCRTEVTGSNR